MIKVSVFYPAGAGKRFDLAYYLDRHTPMIEQRFGPACRRIEIERGVVGIQPPPEPTYVVVAHLVFDSIPDFQAAFAPHADEIMADIPRYTDIEPVIQISEILR